MAKPIERPTSSPISPKSPLILTGADSKFFRSLWQFLLSANRTGVSQSCRWRIYDLGMEPRQLRQLQRKFPWCEIVPFDFTAYPPHVALAAESYAWKPIILADNLDGALGPVFWFDSATLFHDNIERPLEILRSRGIWALKSQEPLDRKCDPRVLERLQVPLEVRHLSEWAAGQVGIDPKNAAAVRLARAWKQHALDPDAIVPPKAAPYHKQDQSVFNCLLLTAAFRGEIALIEDEIDICSHQPFRGISTRNKVTPGVPRWLDPAVRLQRFSWKRADQLYHRIRHLDTTRIDGLQRWYREHFTVHVLNTATGVSREIASPPYGYYADPFVWTHKGVSALFMEEFEYAEDKGRLVVMPLSKDLEPGPATPLSSPPFRGRITSHASYPFIFELGGVPHMIPETHEQRSIDLYVCETWPRRWTLRRRLMYGIEAVDSMVLRHRGLWWLFTSVRGADGRFHLEIHSTLDLLTGSFTPHPQNAGNRYADAPNGTGRNAGYLRESFGSLYRIMQHNPRHYGQGARAMEITELDPKRFREVQTEGIPGLPLLVRELNTHHLSRCGDLIAYDVRDRVR